MTNEQILMAAAAALVAAWPAVKAVLVRALAAVRGMAARPAAAAASVAPAGGAGATGSTAAVVGYEAAIHDLAVVRTRLVGTELLDDKAKAAIDTLTLALVAGSDK